MKSKSVGESRFIAAVEITARNSRGVEGQTHVRKARANELCTNRWIVRESGANSKFVIVKLFREGMLKFESQGWSSKLPKGRGVFQSFAEGSNRVTYVKCNGIGQRKVEASHEHEGARSSFSP